MATARRNITYKIGITGNICSGKSVVLSALQRLGINTFDVEEMALTLLSDNPHRLSVRLSEHFGSDVIDSRGRLSRKKLTNVLYTDPEKRVLFEEKLSPLLREEIKRFLYSRMGSYIRAVEAPLLLESDTRHLYDEVWVVISEPSAQIERVIARDHLSLPEAQHLMDAQWPQDRKIALSDRVIDNTKDIPHTETQVRKVLDEIRNKVFKVGL